MTLFEDLLESINEQQWQGWEQWLKTPEMGDAEWIESCVEEVSDTVPKQINLLKGSQGLPWWRSG